VTLFAGSVIMRADCRLLIEWTKVPSAFDDEANIRLPARETGVMQSEGQSGGRRSTSPAASRRLD
jgi:hypothetical protein